MIHQPAPALRQYRVPERSGEVLIDPAPERLPAMLQSARETGYGGAAILGTPLPEFRRQTASRALALAGHPAATARAPLVVVGHQPVLFHPGVWIKFFLLTRLHAEFGVTGLHLRVDTDAPGAVAAEVPARAAHLLRRMETLVRLAADVPLEAAGAPSEDQWRGFCARVRAHLDTLAAAEIHRCFEAFVAVADAVRPRAGSLGAFLAGARRAYEARAGAPGYAELDVSTLASTEDFVAFALQLLEDPPAFRARYNASLDAYRRARRLRSPANPFPNLDEAGGYQEAPFWVVAGGQRTSLFVRRAGGRLRLRTAGAELGEVPAGREGVKALRGLGIALRPKALTLTMFVRLCLADLFVHGVGGGRYDQVTDAVITEVFGCTPPPYLVASASLMLPLAGTGEAGGDEGVLKRRLMELQHNPERAAAAMSAGERQLVDEKWSLIRAVERMRAGAERRAATHRIREINRSLAAPLAGEIDRVQAELAALGDGQAAGGDAAAFRGYPFFLFDPVAVGRLAGVPTSRP